MELKQEYTEAEEQELHLLIVPYGIETIKPKEKGNDNILLLIVPYGIETIYMSDPMFPAFAFNRTLWN